MSSTMAELDEKAILDLTLEIARLESAERAAYRQWCTAKERKEQKLAELLALSREAQPAATPPEAGTPPETPAEARPAKRKRGPISVKAQALQFLEANPGQDYTVSEIARVLGAPPRSVSVYLRDLFNYGEIARLDYGRYMAKSR